MKILYVRVSSLDQKTDRQRVNENDFKMVVEDRCSGSIPFFSRPGGLEIKKYCEQGILTSLSVLQIDRLGRDLLDILNTINYFNEKKITITFISQGLTTLNADGLSNPISKMVISMLGVVGEIERVQIKERQLEGIRIAKLKGSYTGRKIGSKESLLTFLSKEKNKKAFDYLKKGYKVGEVAKITDLHINTVSKIKKITNQ
ncbi:recombinase family protein [Mucilaginibacter sp.]|uniref:recombinase family protein n=1 Tax=Mucilaginibacter sp. TaxID=1882438 RepID=UPI0025E8AE19|nr:recombinase family protein [Mucilaginibacter sp.]